MSHADKELYEFSDFRLDISERMLLRAGTRVQLSDRAFETLCALVRRSGQLVSKDELMTTVWADAIVEENNLDKSISLLRQALGERRGKTKFIETVRGRGYRFLPEVRQIETAGRATETNGQNDYRISDFGFQNGEETTDGKPKSLERKQFPHSAARTPPANNVIALAQWRREPEAENHRAENYINDGKSDSAAAAQSSAVAPTTYQSKVSEPRPAAKRNFYNLAIILSVCIAALVVGGYGAYKYGSLEHLAAGKLQRSSASPANIEIRRLTTESRVVHPAISPDGKYLAYVLAETGDKESIWLKNIASGSTVKIMPAASIYNSLVFSPDGNYLYFGTNSGNAKDTQIVRVPVFGGARQEIGGNIWGHFALSPDGKQIVLPRGSTNPGETQSLVAVNTETGEERAIVKRPTSDEDKFFFAFWGATPSWSPNGERIAVCGGKKDENGGWRDTIFEVRASDGAMSEMPAPRWANTYQVAWLADGSGLLVVAREKADSPYQIWHLAYPSGAARRVTNDLKNYGKLSLTADSQTLVAQQGSGTGNIWILPDGDTNRARQLTVGTEIENGSRGLAWTPDGRIIYDSKRNGSEELWAINADGSGNPQQLTADANGMNRMPKVTPDGRYIVFVSRRAGKTNIWRMDIDGRNTVRLTDGANDNRPALSPDGRWVYYTDEGAPPSTIAKVSINGDEPVKLTKRFNAYTPVPSPDGKLIAYSHFEDATGWTTGIMTTEGGEPFKLFKLKGIFGNHAWASDSKSLIYIKGSILESNLFRQPIEGDRSPEQITHFKEDRIMSFAYSPDYKQLTLTRGNHYSDIVLINNFK